MAVLRIARLRDHDHFIAIKSMRKDQILHRGEEDHVRSEKAVLTTLNSIFCCRLFGTYVDRRYLCLAVELVPGGDLAGLLTRRWTLPIAEAQFYLAEVLCAIEHMHSHEVVHRDICLEHVCIAEDGHIKVVGFNLARKIALDQRLYTQLTPAEHSSPELLNLQLAAGYDQAVDIWALGVLAYKLVLGRVPFGQGDRGAVLQKINKAPVSFPRHIRNQPFKDFVTKVLCRAWASRLHTVTGVLAHHFFSVEWAAVRNRKVIPPFIPALIGAADCRYFGDISVRIDPKPPNRMRGDELSDF